MTELVAGFRQQWTINFCKRLKDLILLRPRIFLDIVAQNQILLKGSDTFTELTPLPRLLAESQLIGHHPGGLVWMMSVTRATFQSRANSSC